MVVTSNPVVTVADTGVADVGDGVRLGEVMVATSGTRWPTDAATW